jgi:hypothetical protein
VTEILRREWKKRLPGIFQTRPNINFAKRRASVAASAETQCSNTTERLGRGELGKGTAVEEARLGAAVKVPDDAAVALLFLGSW